MPSSRDRWTQDSVWYNFQPTMQKYDIEATREYIKRLIREICAKWGVTRESLGIFAAARAEMHFDGQMSSVNFDAIGALSDNGTDVIFIEKLDLVEVLAPYADKYGVALVKSSGYLTDDAKNLVRAAAMSGGHVTIITDYDMVGLHIASKVPEVPRIGIDEEILDYFGLNKKDSSLSLSYDPRLKIRDFLSNYENVIDRKFLETRRVEIDAVLAAVGSERLWDYIKDKLTKLFPKRDYRRVISEQPKSVSPGAIGDIEDYIEYLKYKATHAKWEEIEKSLANVEGMIDVTAKRKEIEDELQDLITNDERMKVVVAKFEELKTELKIDSDEDFAKYRKEHQDKTKDSDDDSDEDDDVDDDSTATTTNSDTESRLKKLSDELFPRERKDGFFGEDSDEEDDANGGDT